MPALAGKGRLIPDAFAIVAAILGPLLYRALAARMRTFPSFLFGHRLPPAVLFHSTAKGRAQSEPGGRALCQPEQPTLPASPWVVRVISQPFRFTLKAAVLSQMTARIHRYR